MKIISYCKKKNTCKFAKHLGWIGKAKKSLCGIFYFKSTPVQQAFLKKQHIYLQSYYDGFKHTQRSYVIELCLCFVGIQNKREIISGACFVPDFPPTKGLPRRLLAPTEVFVLRGKGRTRRRHQPHRPLTATALCVNVLLMVVDLVLPVKTAWCYLIVLYKRTVDSLVLIILQTLAATFIPFLKKSQCLFNVIDRKNRRFIYLIRTRLLQPRICSLNCCTDRATDKHATANVVQGIARSLNFLTHTSVHVIAWGSNPSSIGLHPLTVHWLDFN